jgi:hypothetical protein
MFGSTAMISPIFLLANSSTICNAGLSRKSSISALKAKPRHAITGF